ncbi:hypothetical protein M0R45_025045 [Rubus argutus]|uniref:Uncharacterized protein n=1 Tax=Rubus argutus TaxID=59490 RepID=A0AAW1WV51_RUBAR
MSSWRLSNAKESPRSSPTPAARRWRSTRRSRALLHPQRPPAPRARRSLRRRGLRSRVRQTRRLHCHLRPRRHQSSQRPRRRALGQHSDGRNHRPSPSPDDRH